MDTCLKCGMRNDDWFLCHQDNCPAKLTATLEAENARLRAELKRLGKEWIACVANHVTVRGEYFARAETAEARVALLEKALQPFAAYLDTAAWDLNNNGDPLPDDHGMGWVYLTIGNFREARAALTPTKEHDHAE